jgi:hypothetical protein
LPKRSIASAEDVIGDGVLAAQEGADSIEACGAVGAGGFGPEIGALTGQFIFGPGLPLACLPRTTTTSAVTLLSVPPSPDLTLENALPPTLRATIRLALVCLIDVDTT